MIPLVDMHCHLFAGLDDGPATPEQALAMCQLAYDDGIRMTASVAHQNPQWPEVTADRIREAWQLLTRQLKVAGVPLTVLPQGEVMVQTDLETSWRAGHLLSLADRKDYLLIEFPHGLFLDLRPLIQKLRQLGLRPILAHPERQFELLDGDGQIEQLIEAGCLVQVNASSVTDVRSRMELRALKDWFQRGIVHVLGSDGHSPTRRPPLMAAAYRQITKWAGSAVADRVCSTNGMAIIQGVPLRVPPVQPRPRSLLARWFG